MRRAPGAGRVRRRRTAPRSPSTAGGHHASIGSSRSVSATGAGRRPSPTTATTVGVEIGQIARRDHHGTSPGAQGGDDSTQGTRSGHRRHTGCPSSASAGASPPTTARRHTRRPRGREPPARPSGCRRRRRAPCRGPSGGWRRRRGRRRRWRQCGPARGRAGRGRARSARPRRAHRSRRPSGRGPERPQEPALVGADQRT